MIKKLLIFTLLFLSLSTFAQERIALVIGNADYQVSALKNALNDAQDITKALEELDFKVTLVENADKRTMKDAIYEFSEKLKKDTVGLFYYAGHAVQYHGENYLIPINALSSIKQLRHLEDEAVRSGMVSREMSVSQSQLNFIFLDACRDNPLPAESRGIEQGLARSQDAEGTLIAYSTSPGKTAEDGTGRNSPYTKNLLKQIYTPNQPIELMLKDVKDAVSNETNGNQLPWYESSITGNFCFKTINDGCAKVVVNIIDNPYLEGLYDLEILDLENGDHYVGQIKNGLFHGKGVLTYKTGAKYQGEFVEGKRHGKGTITQLNGNSFEGNFVEDMRHGKGTLRWINGATIETDWDHGVRVYAEESSYKGGYGLFLLEYHGQGIYTFPSGAYYKGEFKDGTFSGYGVYVFDNGNMYEGEFKNGKFNGYGVYLSNNGDRHEGVFHNDSLTGQGLFSSADGGNYVGEFLNNKFHGQGVYSINGMRREGEYQDGKLNGIGTINWTDGSHFKGEFKDGIRHGQGVVTFSSGKIYKGEFKDGVRHGFGTMIWPNGDHYQGEFRYGNSFGQGVLNFLGNYYDGGIAGDFKRHGQGDMFWNDDNSYFGKWHDDSRNGDGIYIWRNGSRYEGGFKNNMMDGKGIYIWTDGSSYEGDFKNNLRDGTGIFISPEGLRMKVKHENGKLISEISLNEITP